jgi:hypothetical protein
VTLAHLRARADYWRNRLNIKEWRIPVKWGTAKKLGDDEGKIDFCSEDLSATIYLRRGGSLTEETLVHELLHVVIEGDRTEDLKYDVHLERAINRIAAALCHTEQ